MVNLCFDIMAYSIDFSVLRYRLFHWDHLNDCDNFPAQNRTVLKSMIGVARRSVPRFRVRAHQIQDAIPVIVLREIQFASSTAVEETVPIKQNSGVRRTTCNTSR